MPAPVRNLRTRRGMTATLAPAFPRRLRMDRQRMHAAGEFRGQRRIYHTMAVDPGLPFEGRRYDIDAKVRLAARPVAGVTLMQM